MRIRHNIQLDLSLGRKSSWLPVFPVVFFLANLFRMTGHSSMPYMIAMAAAGTLGWLVLFLQGRVKILLWLSLALYFMTMLINSLIIGNLSPTDFVADVFLWGIAYLMISRPCSYRLGFIQFYITAAVFGYSYLTTAGYTHDVLTSSGNYISVLLIISASLYYMALQYSGRPLKLYDAIPSGLCFFFSVWAKGRAGILATAVFFALIMFLEIREFVGNTIMKIFLMVLVFVGIYMVASPDSSSILNWFFQLGKWGRRGTDNSARALIWGEYFAKLKENFLYFLFGAPLHDIPVIAEAGGNCHNSFIQLHAYNGIGMIIYLLVMLCKAVWYYFRHKQWLPLIVLGVFCLRAFTDKFVFGQYGMPILLFLILGPFLKPGPGKEAARQEAGKEIMVSAPDSRVTEG